MLNKTQNYIRAAGVIALCGNALLAVLKIVFGLTSQSSALVGDAIDSFSDVALSVITLVAAGISAKPADKEHPWGHTKAETVGTAFIAFTLFFMGGQLAVNSVIKLVSGEVPPMPSIIAAVIAVVSIVCKLLLALSQYYFGKLSGSKMVKANAKNMASDVLLSLGVLVGLIISYFTGSGLADAVISIFIGAWIIKTALSIFMDASADIMDGASGSGEYQTVFDAVKSVSGAGNPHRARMRKMGGFWDIDIDIEVDPSLTVSQAHIIACNVEDEIKGRLENVFDIMVHVEPRDDKTEESFGLSEENL
jgi:cation diffusion facilitator family transporter